jgi:hypothetical protein
VLGRRTASEGGMSALRDLSGIETA